MRRWAVVLSALTLSVGAASAATTAIADPPDNDPYTLSDGHAQAGPMGGVVNARGVNNEGKPGRPGGGSSPNLSYHGGPVQTATTVKAIFWGTSWASDTSDKVGGIDTFYGGLTASSDYGKTDSEYTNGSNVHVNPVSTYTGHVLDSSALTFSGAPSTSVIANEVVKAIGVSNLVPGGYYPVYVDSARGNAGYCAWHSAATTTQGHIEFQFGFFFKLDGDHGCDPNDTSGLHSQGLAALANVSGHEYSEMVTDPQLNAWYDQQGNENSDKCAWTFNGLETLAGGTQWLIQGNWSNNAYNSGIGYTDASKGFQRGCINGNNGT